MSTINLDQLYQTLESGVVSLAKTSLQEYVQAAQADGQTALTNMKSDLQRWAVGVETGTLTLDDLAFLLKGEEALGEMTALKESGLAEIRIDCFKDDLINLVLGTITDLIKI